MSNEAREPDREHKSRPPGAPRPVRPERPSAPPTANQPQQPTELSPAEYLSSVSDVDDDYVFAPPPDAEAFAQLPAATAARRPQIIKRMTAQRTLIPVLLTLGALMIFTGTLRFVAGEASTVGGLSLPFSVALLLVGLLVLVTAILNILYVRAHLAAQRHVH